MTQELIDDLLQAITVLLDDVRDIQANGSQIDELIANLEMKANDVGMDITELQHDVQKLDQKLAMVMNCMMKNGKNRTFIQRAVN